jgi:hypothetical protein
MFGNVAAYESEQLAHIGIVGSIQEKRSQGVQMKPWPSRSRDLRRTKTTRRQSWVLPKSIAAARSGVSADTTAYRIAAASLVLPGRVFARQVAPLRLMDF